MDKINKKLYYNSLKTVEDISTLEKSTVEKYKKKHKYVYKKSFLEKVPKCILFLLAIILFMLLIFVIIRIGSFLNTKKAKSLSIYTPAIKPKHSDKYRIIAINYANKKYDKAQEWNTRSALEVGDVDAVINYSPINIDKNFYEKNKNIFNQYRGNGLWLWKPYFIYKTIKESLNEGDYLIYSDSSCVYINSTEYFINIMKKKNLDIMAFNLEGQGKYLEKYYTKRDAFVLMGCDSPRYSETYQFITRQIVFKKSKFTENFLKEELKYAQDERIISDMLNTKGETNYDGFIDHRHDQSIFSLLAKKYNLEKFRDPSQRGGYKDLSIEEARKMDDFPIIFYNHESNLDNWEKIDDKELLQYLEKILSKK